MNTAALHMAPEPRSATPSVRIDDETPVVPGVPDISIFGDWIWVLGRADHHDGRAASQCTIDWMELLVAHPAWVPTLKELCWHRLNTRLPTQRTVGVYHAAREQMRFRRFLRWLQVEHPEVTSPGELTQGVLHEYRMWIERHAEGDDPVRLDRRAGANARTGETVSPVTVWNYLGPFRSLDIYADHLATPLPFSPYEGRLSASFLGVKDDGEENTTPVIPDAVLKALIPAALRYVEHYAPTILGMSRDMLAFWKERPRPGTTFPGWTATVGVCPVLKQPWRTPLTSTSKPSHHLFREEMGHLITACLVIILYLSGMRPGEVVNLMEDCLKRPVDPATGLRDRARIIGRPLKKRGSRRREEVEWVVTDAVETAVDMLVTLLAPYRGIHGSRRLALNLNALRRAKERGASTRRRTKPGYPISVTSLGLLIDSFYERVREQQPILVALDPTEHELAPDYQLNPAQFRRTLARHIARQPFGVIAGKIHYHHVSTAIFAGYAGSFDDDFALDVEDERVLAGIDILEQMRTDARAGLASGNAAAKVLQEYERVRDRIPFEGLVDTSAGGIVVDNAVRRLAEIVHVGTLSNCIFDVSKAACLTQRERDEGAPTPHINMCSPDKCGNAVVGACHVPKWKALKDEVDEMMRKARSGPQRASLKAASNRYDAVIRKAEGR